MDYVVGWFDEKNSLADRKCCYTVEAVLIVKSKRISNYDE